MLVKTVLVEATLVEVTHSNLDKVATSKGGFFQKVLIHL